MCSLFHDTLSAGVEVGLGEVEVVGGDGIDESVVVAVLTMSGERLFPDGAADGEADETVDGAVDCQPVVEPRAGRFRAYLPRRAAAELACRA